MKDLHLRSFKPQEGKFIIDIIVLIISLSESKRRLQSLGAFLMTSVVHF